MNAQSPGPLKPCTITLPDGPVIELVSANGEGCSVCAMITENVDDDSKTNEIDANLLAAAYTLLDKAGRDLGVDATELATKLDLAALVRSTRMLAAIVKASPHQDRYPLSPQMAHEIAAAVNSITR